MKGLKHILSALLFISLAAGCHRQEPLSFTPQEQAMALEYDCASMLLSELLGQDIGPDQVTGMKDGTYDPQIGKVLDQSNPFERAVFVDDEEMAETLFRGMLGWRDEILTETADGCRADLSGIELGTLEFFRSDGGANVGYAQVDIPCIPHLQRIVYMTQDQAGENAAPLYESPCGYGDVFYREGRYYICVKEADGYDWESRGILVCVEAGKGTNWAYHLDSEKWGCWQPRQCWTSAQYIVYFLKLCADPGFTSQKRRIVEKLPGKVFPPVQRWSSYDKQSNIGDLTWGFGALEPGYGHVTRYQEDFSKEQSNSDRKKADWYGFKVVVARDATEGNYQFWSARWHRRFHHFVLPFVCRYDKGVYSDTHYYTDKDGWKEFFSRNPIVYTLNAVDFYETLPEGYVLQDI